MTPTGRQSTSTIGESYSFVRLFACCGGRVSNLEAGAHGAVRVYWSFRPPPPHKHAWDGLLPFSIFTLRRVLLLTILSRPTGDLEWYDPKAATTADGKLVITMTQESIHGLNYSSGTLYKYLPDAGNLRLRVLQRCCRAGISFALQPVTSRFPSVCLAPPERSDSGLALGVWAT